MYALAGGVILGAATGLFAAGLAPGAANWWVAGAAALLADAYTGAGSIWHWPLPRRRPKRMLVVAEAHALSGEMMAWLEERAHDGPVHDRDREDWGRYTESLLRFSLTTRAKWQQKF